MKKAMLVLGLVMVLASGCITTGKATERAVLRAKNKVAPALVHVRPVKEIFSKGKRKEVQVVGSGFIISPDGYVVTNEHVAGESKFVRCVLYNKEEVEAKVVGTDPYTDIAVLKLEPKNPAKAGTPNKAADRRLPFCKFGVSAKVESGQTVLALGSPHGLARSVSAGIVSVTDRYLEDQGGDLSSSSMISPYNNWIQTDAAINPGNSGGPLVNLKGEVIGINARILSGAENVGFAIPIDIAREVIEAIIANGRVRRSWIGESLQPMRAKTDDPTQRGVVVADVDPLSPGYEGGLRPGDVMLSIDGKPTDARFEEDLPPVRKQIADIPIGKEAAISVLRGDKEIELRVKTVEKSELKGNEIEFPKWGFTAAALTPENVRQAQLASNRGVLVSGAQVGGLAANARLQRGDIILKMDEEEIKDIAGFQEMYKARVESKKRLVMLVVKRGALTRFVLIKQDAQSQPGAEESGNGGGLPDGTEGEHEHVE